MPVLVREYAVLRPHYGCALAYPQRDQSYSWKSSIITQNRKRECSRSFILRDASVLTPLHIFATTNSTWSHRVAHRVTHVRGSKCGTDRICACKHEAARRCCSGYAAAP